MNKKHILIVSRCNTDNYGDQIIAKCVDHLFDYSEWCVKHVDYKFSPPRLFESFRLMSRLLQLLMRPLYKYYCLLLLRTSDAVIIGGGELLSVTFVDELLIWLKEINRNKRIKYKYLFSMGVSGDFSFEQKSTIRNSIADFTRFFFRDNLSKDLFVEAFEPSLSKLNIMPDCVFSIKSDFCKSKKQFLFGITSLERHNRHGRIHFDSELELFEYYHSMLVNCFITYPDHKCILIYNTDSDLQVTKNFYRYLINIDNSLKSTIEIPHIRNEKSFIKLIRDSVSVTSPRMHTCIIATIYNKEVNPIIISDKMHSFFELYTRKKCDLNLQRNEVYRASQIIYEEIR